LEINSFGLHSAAVVLTSPRALVEFLSLMPVERKEYKGTKDNIEFIPDFESKLRIKGFNTIYAGMFWQMASSLSPTEYRQLLKY
jgi:hypothetical protein